MVVNTPGVDQMDLLQPGRAGVKRPTIIAIIRIISVIHPFTGPFI